MSNEVGCPICNNVDDRKCYTFSTGGRDSEGFECDICGKFELTRTLFQTSKLDDLTRPQKALISYKIRNSSSDNIMLGTGDVDHIIQNENLPNPSQRVAKIIQYIGDQVSKSGERIQDLSINFYTYIGAPSYLSASEMILELHDRDIVKGMYQKMSNYILWYNLDLTLSGWDLYQQEKQGKLSGDYGFIAMQFNDEILDRFVQENLRDIIKNELGYDLHDMREVARAGIIDNIMRTEIRDAAFILADLTHNNPGAYWEAGYAEGLGKPVIYLCEQNKFEQHGTHFDTNHCTTVKWDIESEDKLQECLDKLIQTIRLSLNI